MVKVFDVESILRNASSAVEDCICQGVVRDVFGDVWINVGKGFGRKGDICRVRSEEVEVVEVGVVLVSATQTDYDQADQRSNSHRHRREDAGKSAGFPHDDGRFVISGEGVRYPSNERLSTDGGKRVVGSTVFDDG